MIGLAILTGILAFVTVLATTCSLLKRDEWWIRMFDFPRIQISFAALAAITLLLIQWSNWITAHWILLVLLALCLIYQLAKIYPYTIFAKKQVRAYKGGKDKQTISILISNVLTPNKRYDALISSVRKFRPDLLLTLESDHLWEAELQVLEKYYPFTVKVPLDNLY